MKAAVVYAQRFMNRPYISLPNAATRRQLLRKYINSMLVGVCCAGIVVTILFLMTLA